MSKDAKFHVANRLNDHTIIGGPGKIDLYRSHLVTLNNMIEKIASEEEISNLLVALATGSGKTYVQALWMMVLSFSGNNAIFAVPDKLVAQLRNDLTRVLPQNLVDDLLILRDNEECQETVDALNDFSAPTKPSRIIIASADRLLDKHYQQLLEASPERTFLSFDEQHLLMKSERHRVRLIELSKKMLSMFLTATPNEETYQLSGNKPVAIMSSGQKQAAGQGQFPELFEEHARNISDKNQLHDWRFWTAEFWENMFRGLLLRFTNAVQPEQSSAAVSIVENLPLYLHRKSDETDVRWSMQVPMARKMLCIIDDNEALVNFCHALEEENECMVYHEGNLVDRRSVTGFFGLPEVDATVIREDLAFRRDQYRDKLDSDEMSIGTRIVSKTLKEQIKDNIFHYMMEYVLTDLTALDDIEHNRLRKKDPKGFMALIRDKFVVRSAEYYQEKLGKLIDDAGAHDIAYILHRMSLQLENMQGSPANPENFNDFADNWALDDSIVSVIKQADPDLAYRFEHYANRHLMMSVMTGMEDSETPIEASRPFSGLAESRYSMYRDGVLSDKAKRRQHNSLETLDDESRESTFTPSYLNFHEETCDNYFRLGFVGVYVSNKKTEGFSDRNLHTVINLAENKLDTTNNPETMIQGIGRNRGLDETIVPVYIHALGRGQESVFDLKHLKSDDYYPELFKSQSAYNQKFVTILGKKVGQDIIRWFRNNIDKEEQIDNDKLKKKVLKIIAKALRKLNNSNSHDIQLSRSQLTGVVSEAMAVMSTEIARINEPYKLTLSVKVLGSILNFISECYYTFKIIYPAFQRLYHSWFGPREETSYERHPDDVYIKVINNTDFKDLVENLSVIRELRGGIVRKNSVIEAIIENDLESYLKDSLKEKISKYKQDLIAPLLSKLAVESKREMVFNAIKDMPNIMGFFAKKPG